MVLALPPRRPALMGVALALLVMLFMERGTGSLWYFERGWTLLLASWFIVLVVALPKSGFVARAIGAVGATAATASVFLLSNAGGFTRLDTAISQRLRTATADATAGLTQLLRTQDGPMAADLPANMYRMAELQSNLFPALLGLASLAALGAGWWLFRRFAASDQEPLRPLREFRFSDHLIWVLLIGALLLLLPANEEARRAGSNLLAFMAPLYVLRGLGVMLVIGGAPGPFGWMIGAVLFLLLGPLIMAATMIVGLTDTWLDIRAKRPNVPTPGS
jgi:hypothetical protein